MKKTIFLTLILLIFCGVFISISFVTAGADSIHINHKNKNSIHPKSDSIVKTYKYSVDFVENGNFTGSGTFLSPYPIRSPEDIPVNSIVFITQLSLYGIVVSHCEGCHNVSIFTTNTLKCKPLSTTTILYNPPKNLYNKKLICAE